MADSTAVQKLLMDGKAEARQKGSQEVAQVISRYFREIPPPESYAKAANQIELIEKQLLHNVSVNPRKGGINTLRTIVGVVPLSENHGAELTETLCKVTFPLVRDQDSSIRIMAMETCHQIVQKFKVQVFHVAFSELFRAMLSAVSDKERKVVQAGREVSSTVRQVVTDTNVRDFPTERFVDFLNLAFSSSDPQVVNWVLDWHKHVNFLPAVGLVNHLSKYLRNLFKLLEMTDCAFPAESTLLQALDDVKTNAESLIVSDLMKISLDFCCVPHKNTRRVALEWVHTLLHVGHERMLPLTHNIANAIVDQQSGRNDESIRSLACRINQDLQELVTARVMTARNTPNNSPMISPKHCAATDGDEVQSQLLERATPGNTPSKMDGMETSVNTAAGGDGNEQHQDPTEADSFGNEKSAMSNANAVADEEDAQLRSDDSNVSMPNNNNKPASPIDIINAIDCTALAKLMIGHLRSEVQSHLAALKWIVLLHRTFPEVVQDLFDYIFDSVLETFSNPSPEVLEESIKTLSTIAGVTRFGHFIQMLLMKMEKHSNILLPKASTIIKHLQLWYQGDSFEACENVFLKIAEILPSHGDKRYVCKVVITLNTMLLTSHEMRPLRDLLRNGVNNQRARDAFRGLFCCWCYDSIATIALCLLTKAYDLAHTLVVLVGNAEMSPHTLVQLDRLVQLLESPVFSYIRIALLSPRQNVALVRTLFGLQMVLPQTSDQYQRLHKRLKTVSSVVLLEEKGQDDIADTVMAPAVLVGMSADNEIHERELPPLTPDDWIRLKNNYVRIQEEVVSYEMLMARACHQH